MIDIIVKMWTEETLEFSVDPLDTVGQLKSSIAKMKGPPPDKLQLFHHGEEMGNGSLSDYGIVKASAVY